MAKQRYNNLSIEKIFRANMSLMKGIKVRSTKGGSSTQPPDHQNPRQLCLKHVSRLMNLKTEHFRGINRARFVDQFERERSDCLERIWHNYQKLSSYVDREFISEGAVENTTALMPGVNDPWALPSFMEAILQHHIVHAGNSGSVNNGVYYKPREAKRKPLRESVRNHLWGMVCDHPGPRSETREEFLRFSKVDKVVGGRRVSTLGGKFTKAVDNQPNPVRDRCGEDGYLTRINAGDVRVHYMNGGGDQWVRLTSELNEKPVKAKQESQEEPGKMDELQGYTRALAEIRRTEDNALLFNAKSYLSMSDDKFANRINQMASEGEAILAEDERKLKEQING